MHAMEISRTGLDVEWRRLEVIADNLANAGSVGSASGAYQPMRLVSGPKGGFAAALREGSADRLQGVEVYSLEPSPVSAQRVYEPDNPQADASGMVSYPGVDHAAEMTLMVKTARIYEANVVALNTARQMYSKALELGRKA